jgi:signal transduction histidine kinase
MEGVLTVLEKLLPFEIAVLAVVFFYLLVLFKRLAEQLVAIAAKQASLAETQTSYIQQRLDAVEQFIGISDKVINLRDKHIEKLEKLAAERDAELAQSRATADDAKRQLSDVDARYHDAVSTLNLQAEELKRLQEAHEQLARATRDDAIAELTHELRIRLQALVAHAELLATDPELTAVDVRQGAQEILNAALALDVVIDTVAADSLPYRFQRVPVTPLIERIVGIYQAEAHRKSVAIVVDVGMVDSKPPMLRMSERHVALALANLVANAVKYSYRGSETAPRKVTVIGRHRDAISYAIEIANFGVGVMPEEVAAVFQPGYRGRMTLPEYRGGTGMGLSVARRIAERHAGRIELSSHAVTGDAAGPYLTKVTMRLPYAGADAEHS